MIYKTSDDVMPPYKVPSIAEVMGSNIPKLTS